MHIPNILVAAVLGIFDIVVWTHNLLLVLRLYGG